MEKDTRYQPLDKASISADQISRPSVSYWKDAWRRFRKDKLAVFGLVMILIVSLFAIFGPMFCPYAYDEADFLSIAQWPSKAHWFGTDALGRDLYVRVLYGARISLSIGVLNHLFHALGEIRAIHHHNAPAARAADFDVRTHADHRPFVAAAGVGLAHLHQIAQLQFVHACRLLLCVTAHYSRGFSAFQA